MMMTARKMTAPTCAGNVGCPLAKLGVSTSFNRPGGPPCPFRPRIYSRRRVVQVGGDASKSVFLLRKGLVFIEHTNKDGETMAVDLAAAPTALGLDQIDGQPSPDVAQTVTVSEICVAPIDTLAHTLGRHPDLALGLVRSVSTLLRSARYRMATLASKQASARIAGLLLELDKLGMTSIPITRDEMGRLAGLRSETVSRILTRLRKAKVLSLRGRVFGVIDRVAMEKLAAGEIDEESAFQSLQARVAV